MMATVSRAGGNCSRWKSAAGHGNRTARLGHQARAKDNAPHGLANLGLGHGHDVIDISLHVSEIQYADALASQSIGGRLASARR